MQNMIYETWNMKHETKCKIWNVEIGRNFKM